jgi:Domain of unknown function (DUF4397)
MGSDRAATPPAHPTTYPSNRRAATALALLVLVAIAALPLLATPAAAASGTYVRFAQLTTDMAGDDLVLSSISDPQRSVTVPGQAYGGLSEYRLVQPGDYVVGITPKGAGGSPAVSLTLNAMTGTAYTVAAVGKANQTQLTVLTDDLTPPEQGNAKIRVIGAAAGSPTLDVRGPDGEFALGLGYGKASRYRTVSAGATTLSAGAPGAPAVQLPISVAPNQVASVVLVDRGGNLAAEVRIDAEGPTQIPPGAIKAGYGGAAPGQPSELTGVLTFGVLALLAAVLARFLARRTGSPSPRP